MSEPIDPRTDRFEPIAQGMRRALVVVFVLAVATVVVPGRASDVCGYALVGLLVVIPLTRVVWFVRRWFSRGDPRFAYVGLGVLAVVAIGLVLGALTS